MTGAGGTALRFRGHHYDGIIFDCDGVLVDSERITSRVWAGLLTGIGLPTTTEQSLATYLGNSMGRCGRAWRASPTSTGVTASAAHGR